MIDQANITKDHLETLEAIVREGMQGFIAVGLSLIEIRECEGYRLRGFQTFESYCQAQFGFTARHGRRMIQAAQTTREVVRVTGQAIRRESVARALTPVVGNDKALRHVKARLEARGQTIGNAPARIVHAIVSDVLNVAISDQPIMGVGLCPECGQIPRAYRRVENIWQCGSCGVEVIVSVKRIAGDRL